MISLRFACDEVSVFRERDARVPQLRKLYYSIGEAADDGSAAARVEDIGKVSFRSFTQREQGKQFVPPNMTSHCSRGFRICCTTRSSPSPARASSWSFGLDDETPKTI